MAQKQADIEIGHRAYEEAIRLFNTPGTVNRRIGIGKSTVHEWKEGQAPGGLALARLHYAGADVLYILTGKKSKVG